MNPFSFLYNEILYRPLLNLVVGLTNNLPGHDVGWAIILVTIIVRVALVPISLHQARKTQENQENMAKVQAQLAKAKEKYKDDKAKQAEETMRIYREGGVSPASGCLPLLIQLPILIALYRVFLSQLSPDTYPLLYSFVGQPEMLSLSFFGIDLTAPGLRLGILAGAAQFVQMKFLMPSPPPTTNDNDAAAVMSSMQKNMAYIFPAMTVFISLQLPAALALYWLVSTLFGIGQQYYFRKKLNISSTVPVV